MLRCPFKSIPLLLLLGLLLPVTLTLAQYTAKDHFKSGRRLLKQNLIYDAYDQFKAAANLAPRNKKFQRKLAEVGRIASPLFEAKSLNASPSEALRVLKKALEYDPSNISASERLSQLRQEIESASIETSLALDNVNLGKLDSVIPLLQKLSWFRDVVPAINELEQQLQLARTALSIQSRWVLSKDVNSVIQGVLALDQPEASSDYVRSVSDSLKKQLSEWLIQEVKVLPGDAPETKIKQLRALDRAQKLTTLASSAVQLQEQLTDQLARQLYGDDTYLPSDVPNGARVVLAALRLTEQWTSQHVDHSEALSHFLPKSYPAATARLLVSEITKMGIHLTQVF